MRAFSSSHCLGGIGNVPVSCQKTVIRCANCKPAEAYLWRQTSFNAFSFEICRTPAESLRIGSLTA